MRVLTAVALALTLLSIPATAASSAPRNPECAPLGKIFRATVQARQKGIDRKQVESLAATLEGDLKPKALGIINTVYSEAVYATAPAATASAFFSASCR